MAGLSYLSSMDKKHKTWLRHLGEEVDAAYLYGVLEKKCPASPERESYRRLAAIEQKHVDAWSALLSAEDEAIRVPGPSVKARLMMRLSAVTGISWLRQLMLKEEGNEVRSYLSLYRTSRDAPTRELALRLARDSAGHAENLNELSGQSGEPWHQASSGGILRSVVYGFNDGLTANFGLIAGVIGAQASDHFILISGAAGLIADALSMGASGYLAAKSEQDVYDHEITMEADEIRLMPDLEREELAAIYQAKGMEQSAAERLAREVMEDPTRALEEKVREELGLTTEKIQPMKEAWMTGTATAIGAAIPLIPFFFWKGDTAIILAFVLAMGAHFGVGGLRSLFTGRGLLRSGWEMLLVGMGVAVVGYLLGDAITHWL